VRKYIWYVSYLHMCNIFRCMVVGLRRRKLKNYWAIKDHHQYFFVGFGVTIERLQISIHLFKGGPREPIYPFNLTNKSPYYIRHYYTSQISMRFVIINLLLRSIWNSIKELLLVITCFVIFIYKIIFWVVHSSARRRVPHTQVALKMRYRGSFLYFSVHFGILCFLVLLLISCYFFLVLF